MTGSTSASAESWEAAIADVKAKGGKPYAIPAGASVHKYGGLGYVGFAEEVRAQEKELGFAFDYIIVCTVTGSTHAGMLVGFAKDGRERKVIGIDASFTPAQTRAQVLQIAQQHRRSRRTRQGDRGGRSWSWSRTMPTPPMAFRRRRPRRPSACARGSKA